ASPGSFASEPPKRGGTSMCPCRSLLPTIEIVIRAAGSAACGAPACVGGATSSDAASRTALVYDARLRVVRWGMVLLVMTGAAACGGKMLSPPGGTGTGGTGGSSGNRWV